MTPYTTLVTVQETVRQAWRWRILPAMKRREPDALLAALVVADAGLDAVLLAAGYAGTTAGERLQNASNSFSNYAGIRAARHLRNQVVHRLDYRLCWCAAHAALDAYARGLWEYGVDLRGVWYADDDAVDASPAPVLLFPHNVMCGKAMAGERADVG